MNSLDSSVKQYELELCKRLQTQKDQSGNDISLILEDDLADN